MLYLLGRLRPFPPPPPPPQPPHQYRPEHSHRCRGARHPRTLQWISSSLWNAGRSRHYRRNCQSDWWAMLQCLLKYTSGWTHLKSEQPSQFPCSMLVIAYYIRRAHKSAYLRCNTVLRHSPPPVLFNFFARRTRLAKFLPPMVRFFVHYGGFEGSHKRPPTPITGIDTHTRPSYKRRWPVIVSKKGKKIGSNEWPFKATVSHRYSSLGAAVLSLTITPYLRLFLRALLRLLWGGAVLLFLFSPSFLSPPLSSTGAESLRRTLELLQPCFYFPLQL